MNKEFLKIMNVLRNNKISARENLLDYMYVIKEDYKPAWFHKAICEELTEFARTKKAVYKMLFMPPQNGKSLHSTVGLPTFLLGQNPKLKIAVISYNDTTASLFGDEISKVLKSAEYKSIFPDVELSGKDNKYITETKQGGYIISVGVNGSLTSRTVDVFIFDDLYKSSVDAWSPVYRLRVWNFFNTVADTRGHKNEKMLILYTRWHEDDLAGVLLNLYPEKWKTTLFQGIKTNEFSHPADKRKEGEILWPERHSLQKYKDLEKRDPVAFEALIQQNPKAKEGLMYETHKTYKGVAPAGIRKCYVDTADTGSDYLSAIFYNEVGVDNYITDILFTQDKMEDTYIQLAQKIKDNETWEVVIEGNNGGTFYASQVEKEARKLKSLARFDTFHQSTNKDARIYSYSADVQEHVYFPEGWGSKYPVAYKQFTGYRRMGKNEHDDFPDSITGTRENNRALKYSRY